MIVKESEIRKLIIKKLLEEDVARTGEGETDYNELLNQAAQGVAALGVVTAVGPAAYGAIKGAAGGMRLSDDAILDLYRSNVLSLSAADRAAFDAAYEAAIKNLDPSITDIATATPTQKLKALESVAETTLPGIKPSYNAPRPSGTSGAIRYGLKSAGKGAKGALSTAATKFGKLGTKTKLGAVTIATISAAAYWANRNAPLDPDYSYESLFSGRACAEMKNAFDQLAAYYDNQGESDYAKKISEQPKYMSAAEATLIADNFWAATKSYGSTFGQIATGRLPFGAGTDEDLIKTTIESLDTALDLCQVAAIFKTKYGMELGTALRGDLDSKEEIKTYILDPIAVKAKDAYVNFLGDTYGYEPWQELILNGHLMIEKIVEAENQDAAAADYVANRESDTYFTDDGYSQRRSSVSRSGSGGGIVTMGPTDPYIYKVGGTGCWVTKRKRSSSGKWISLSGHPEAMAKLDRRFPDLRTQAQKDKCLGSSSGGSGVRSVSSASAIADAEESLSVSSGSSSRNRRLGPKDLEVSINMYNDPNVETLNEFCNNNSADGAFKEMIVQRMREHFRSGGRANVFKRDETINIAVDFNRKGDKVKSVKRVKGSESFQLLRFSGIRDGIKRFFVQYPPDADVSGPNRGRSKRGQPDLEIIITFKSGVYTLSEVAQLKNIIRKLLK